MSVYLAAIQYGETILGMNLSPGGHLTHGHPLNFSGLSYKVFDYGVSRETETIDYDELQRIAEEHRPKLLVCGASAYPRIIDFKRISDICQSIGARMFADHADPKRYHYVPVRPRLVTDAAGNPDVKLIKYHLDPATQGSTGAGLFLLSVDLEVPGVLTEVHKIAASAVAW
jgi:hypothetical protein